MQLIRRLVRSLGFEAGSAAERSPPIMAPTREEAGEKGRLMLLPRRHWLPSAGNNAVLFSPGSCSDQQNGLALLCSAWRQCPILSYRGLGKTHPSPSSSPLLTYPYSPQPQLHSFTFPPSSVPPLSVILATFSSVQRALTKKLSALREPASASELSHTPCIR